MTTATIAAVKEQEYDKYLEDENIKIANRIAMERTIKINDAARKLVDSKGIIDIRLRIPEGEIENVFGQKEIVYKDGVFDSKIFRFKKMATSDWNLYMMKRAELQNENAKPADQIDQTKVADLNIRIYEYLAMKFYGITHDEYIRAEWDDIKLAVEVANHLTETAHKSVSTQAEDDNLKFTLDSMDSAINSADKLDEMTRNLNRFTTDSSSSNNKDNNKKDNNNNVSTNQSQS